ncbi:MAG: SDR family oxidoreductase [Planctomycetes bacterium]|nr:SDR family oxidoreductase [Planctomycetota bacterium]MCD7895081.1 SDR family oxidoreductase [Planctomycetaceae bacterium]
MTVKKVIIVTGASSGIGAAIARRMAKEGAFLALAARREDKLRAVRDEITDTGGRAEYYQVDVTAREQVETMVGRVMKDFGRIDVLVNNAGLMAMAPLAAGKVDEWDRMIDINVKGLLYGVAAVWPVFEKQRSGHFINISSVAGLKVSAGVGTVYSATKFAVKAIAEGIRAESAGKFRSTVIYPGYVESELMLGSSDETTKRGVMDAYAKYAISADRIGDAVAYAVAQPDDTAVNEITIRPTSQEF